MKFPQYISTTNRTVSVIGMVDKDVENETDVAAKTFEHGKGYIAEDQSIWIFCSEEPRNKNEYPYFWFDEDGNKVFSEPEEIVKKAYNVENMVDLSLVNIIETTKAGEKLFDEEEIENMNAASSFYVPTINKNDDFLKKIVKAIIIKKGVDINKLKAKTGEKYVLPNMKAALQNQTKMSVMYFSYWMKLLCCDIEITVVDNGEDTKDVLKNPIVYQSYRDGLGTLENGQLVDMSSMYNEEEDKDEKET